MWQRNCISGRERQASHFLPWVVGNGEVDSGKQQGPQGLPGVGALGSTEIFQVFMVGPDQEWLFCSFQPVPPLFQRHLNPPGVLGCLHGDHLESTLGEVSAERGAARCCNPELNGGRS